MRNVIALLAALGLAAFLSGCAGPEQKFGRGMDNVFETVRLGELQRSIEQNTVLESPDVGYTYGFVHGLNRSLLRTGVGVYEVVTFPIPPYHPVLTETLNPHPVYPDSYFSHRHSVLDDTYCGFSGGILPPFLPGSSFSVYDN